MTFSQPAQSPASIPAIAAAAPLGPGKWVIPAIPSVIYGISMKIPYDIWDDIWDYMAYIYGYNTV
jgi:hypothetical protein